MQKLFLIEKQEKEQNIFEKKTEENFANGDIEFRDVSFSYPS